MKVDKTLVASVALHVLVIGWGLVSFSSKAFESAEVESVPVEFVTTDQLSKITAGIKSGKKENPKPLVEKVAEAKPEDDPVGKVTEKKAVTDAAPEPKPPEKPVEKKPDPPKPVAETKPKDEPKPIEKKPDPPKDDPIAEALKKDEAKKPLPKPEAKAAPQPPQPPKPKERTFDQSKIAALLDKRDPTRQSITGSALNSSASLGSARGTAATLSQSELDALRARLTQLWNVQAGTERPEELIVDIHIRLTPDRRLAAPPEVVSHGSSPRYQAAAEAAMRAVLQGQPYDMLRTETYEQWKDMIVTFDPRQMFRS